MATAMNGVRYTFPVLNGLVDNTLTALTTITIEIPERVVTFHTVTAKLTWDDVISATGGTIASRRVQLGLGGGTKTNVVNSNAIANSGENISGHWTVDFTSRFSTSWSGTSMTCEADVLIDQSTGTGLGANNVQLTLDITYEYDVSTYDITADWVTAVVTSKSGGSPVAHGLAVGALVRLKDIVGGSGVSPGIFTVATVPTSSTFTLDVSFAPFSDITAGTMLLSPTRLKTARIPLTAPKGALATSKPGSPSHTIPALDTELPEAGKSFVQMTIESWANAAPNGVTTTGTVNYELDSIGAHTTGNYINALATDRQVRYCVAPSYFVGLDTSVTHVFYMWAGTRAGHNHPAVWLYVTYKYDEETTTSIWVDVMLLCNAGQNVAGGGSSAPSVVTSDLWIPEQNVASKGTAFCWQIGSASSISSLNARLARGSYVTITDAGSQMACGSVGMEVNNTAYTLKRGRNRLEFSIYHSGGDDSLGLTGWFHASYTCDKPAGGSHRANKTISLGRAATGTSAFAKNCGAVSVAPTVMPEAATWFMQNFGLLLCLTSNATPPTGLFGTGAMASGDIGYRNLGSWHRSSDSETGYQLLCLAPPVGVFVWPWAAYYKGSPRRFDEPGNPTETSSIFVTFANGAATTAQGSFDIVYTYHTIPFTAQADVSGSAGAGERVRLVLHRHTHQDVAVTGVAATDVFTTVGNKIHNLAVGDSVRLKATSGGAGLTTGWYSVATVPSPSTFTCTGANITTDMSAGTARLPVPNGGEKIAEDYRVGNGTVDFTVYDDTEPLYFDAYEDDTHLFRSAPFYAS